MAPIKLIDSHVHLWPKTAANESGHRWMTPGFQLTKEHILSSYVEAAEQNHSFAETRDVQVEGIIYVETDRRLSSPFDPDGQPVPLTTWAAQPLDEIRFLRDIVEGRYGEADSRMLLGIVLWAPVHLSPAVFEEWLSAARAAAGEETWKRVKGFRYLLQSMTDRADFEKVVFSDDFMSVLKSFKQYRGGRNFVFDVGVDQHSAGVWQLENFIKVIDRVHEGVEEDGKVTFVLNHLCKPDYTIGSTDAPQSKGFRRWQACIKRFAHFPNVFIKLSGAFSEMSLDRVATTSSEELSARLKAWTDSVFDSFPADRIMFGSDWPVCNVRGPAVEQSWSVWKDIVTSILAERKLDDRQKQCIWLNTAKEAYGL